MSAPRRSSRQSTPTSERPEVTPSSTRKSTNSTTTRPNLPKEGNNLLLNYTGKLHKVKLQTLNLGNNSSSGINNTITIARAKIAVPKGVPGHIIKRFDTNAISASSLFRAAFPLATDAEEVTEMNWISKGSKGKYGDTKIAGAENNEAMKLSGTWIPAAKATALAEEYNVTKFAADLIAFVQPLAEGDSTAVVPDSEVDSPAAPTRTTKRQRVASPSALSTSASVVGGVSIHQTLATDLTTGIKIETTSVEIETPGSLLLPSGDKVENQIAEAKSLVKDLKESNILIDLNKDDATTSSVVDSKKRSHEDDEEEEEEDEEVVDTRGFFGKMFKKAPRSTTTTRRVPKNGGRETVGLSGSQIAVLEKQAVTPDGRRWIAGFGLAVAVTATAAAPYLFG